MHEDLQARLEQALADNAALLQALLDVAELRLSAGMLDALAAKLRAEPHPGAALLREVLARRQACVAGMRVLGYPEWIPQHALATKDFLDACAAADAAKEKTP